MIVSELKLYNFRRFKSIEGKPGLHIFFHKGLNALIGENDSGKTAVIDAIKMVLLTQSNEYIRVLEEDFFSENGTPVSEFKIDLILSEFNADEAKNFVEYLMFERIKMEMCSTHFHFIFVHGKKKNEFIQSCVPVK